VIDAELSSRLAGKRVLITGGLGFIGSTLARELVAADVDVLLVDSLVPEYGGNLANVAGIEDRLTINISDVRDEHSLRYLFRDRDVIFNLAGQTSHLDSMTNPFTDLEINCRSQLSILEVCRHENPQARVVFASTRQIYGRPEYVPVDERHPIHPVDVNGINKTAGEWYHLLYGNVYGIAVSVLRLTNTYGPRMRVRDARQTFLGHWLHQILTGAQVTVWGDGRQRRDFNYVDDVVRALLLAATEADAVGRVYNLGHHEVHSLEDVARMLVEECGAGSYVLQPFPEARRQIDIGDYFGSYDRIRDDLRWEPQIDLREGLRRSLEFYRANGDKYWGPE
jgi:UDP-glucose 4-epimerase